MDLKRLSRDTYHLEVLGPVSIEGQDVFVGGKSVSGLVRSLLEMANFGMSGTEVRFGIRLKRLRWRRRPPKDREAERQMEGQVFGRWMAVPAEDDWLFVTHLKRGGDRVAQVILSGDPATDGVYSVAWSDGLFGRAWSRELGYHFVIRLRGGGVRLGTSNDARTLKRQLVAGGLVSEEDFNRYYCAGRMGRALLAAGLPKAVIHP